MFNFFIGVGATVAVIAIYCLINDWLTPPPL